MLQPRYGWSMRQASALLLVPDTTLKMTKMNFNSIFQVVNILGPVLQCTQENLCCGWFWCSVLWECLRTTTYKALLTGTVKNIGLQIPCKWSFVLWKEYAENHLIKNHDNWFLHKIEENERGFPICKNVNNRESQASPPNVRTSLIGPQKYCRPITEFLPFWHHNPWKTYF